MRVAKGMRGFAASPAAADWDSDGDVDLVVGSIEGALYFVRNEGDAKSCRFATPIELAPEERAPLGDAGPAFADWDGDGLLDLIVGSGTGEVAWFRNAGTLEEPELEGRRVLLEAGGNPWAADDVGETSAYPWGARTKPCATDFDGDGRLDLLIGDFQLERLPEPELRPSQRAALARVRDELEQAQSRCARLGEEWGLADLRRRRQLLSEPADVESVEQAANRTRALAEVESELARVDWALRPLHDRIAELQAQLPPETREHGYVWFFARRKVAR